MASLSAVQVWCPRFINRWGGTSMAGWLTLCSVCGCVRFWPVLPWVDDWWGWWGLTIGNEEFNTVFTGGLVVALTIGTLSDHRFACLNRLKTLVGGVLLHTEGAYIDLGFALEFLVSETLAFSTPFGGLKCLLRATMESIFSVLCSMAMHDLPSAALRTLHLVIRLSLVK